MSLKGEFLPTLLVCLSTHLTANAFRVSTRRRLWSHNRMTRARFCDYSGLRTKQTNETKTPNPPEQSQVAASLLNIYKSNITLLQSQLFTSVVAPKRLPWLRHLGKISGCYFFSVDHDAKMSK